MQSHKTHCDVMVTRILLTDCRTQNFSFLQWCYTMQYSLLMTLPLTAVSHRLLSNPIIVTPHQVGHYKLNEKVSCLRFPVNTRKDCDTKRESRSGKVNPSYNETVASFFLIISTRTPSTPTKSRQIVRCSDSSSAPLRLFRTTARPFGV